MKDGGSIIDHFNVFNIIVAQLGSIGDKIEEDHCMLLFCYFANLWDHLVMYIGSNTTKLKIDEVVALLFS